MADICSNVGYRDRFDILIVSSCAIECQEELKAVVVIAESTSTEILDSAVIDELVESAGQAIANNHLNRSSLHCDVLLRRLSRLKTRVRETM